MHQQDNISEYFTNQLGINNTYLINHESTTMLFDYSGVIDQELLKKAVNFHEGIFNDIKACNSYRRKVITSIIEILQNITRYGVKNSSGHTEGKFASSYNNTDFVLECTNEINSGQLSQIKEQLQDLSLNSIDSLKKIYMKRINEDWLDQDKGAKLGLLYLFINSEKNISFSFHNNQENNYLFALKISLKR